MARHRFHSVAFKREVAAECSAGETLHALSKRHDISRQLIQIWIGKFEAGAPAAVAVIVPPVRRCDSP